MNASLIRVSGLALAACAPMADDDGLDTASGPPEVCVNELMASNQLAWIAPDGSAPDWVELHNPTDEAVSLEGWSFTDDVGDPRKHPLPLGLSVPARGFLMLFPDGDPEQGLTHLPFKLDRDGEAAFLVDPDGRRDGTTFGLQASDYSLARVPDCCEGDGCWQAVFRGTPGGPNEAPPP